MAAVTVDCVHAVSAPVCIVAEAILEGHAELLGGTCDRCGHTVVGLYTHHTLPVEWKPVGDIVRKVRKYQRQAVTDQLLGGSGQSLEAGS